MIRSRYLPDSIVARKVSASAFSHSLDPKEKSAVSEEAEHWPLNAAREASQDRGQSWPPWPVRHVPTGGGGGAEGTVPKILSPIDDLRPRPVPAQAEDIHGDAKIDRRGVCE